MSEHIFGYVQEPRLLLVARLNGQEFLVDVENRQFKSFKDLDGVIEMHSEQGRMMLEQIQGIRSLRR